MRKHGSIRGAACTAVTAIIVVVAAAQRAEAQDVVALLPDSVAERLVAFHNSEFTTRLTGDARIGPGTVMNGGVAVLGGSLTVEGRIEGDVVVINGDLVVSATGTVTGNATVAGGDAMVEPGRVAGAVRVYRESLRYRHVGAAITYVPPDLEEGISAGRDFHFGRTEVMVSSYDAYSRAEGLPIAAGPRIRIGGPRPLAVRALLIARTAVPDGINHERIGFDIRVEKTLVADLGFSMGAGVSSVIAPIETSGLTDRESALATFLLHTDYRDQYSREGWTFFTRLAMPGAPYSLQVTYRDETHARAGVAHPAALAIAHDEWRPQSAVAEGTLRSLTASLQYDTRNEPRDPSAGWLIEAGVERAIGGSLVNPASFDPDSATIVSRGARETFLTGRIDVRRYARLSPFSRIGLRVVAAGSIDGEPLPPQRQHALGGEGTLPGYRLFEFDCGARNNTVEVGGNAFYPYYGCDRMAAIQIEYQAGFPFARRLSDMFGPGISVGHLARWVAFVDAGRAWNEAGSSDGRSGGNADFSVDAGLGVRLGPFGAYWALPLSGHGHGFNMFIRLAPRL